MGDGGGADEVVWDWGGVGVVGRGWSCGHREEKV